MNYKNKSLMTKKKAFTLIELLIVIAIIGILFIVLVSKVDFATDKAKATGVQTDFRSFQMAFDTVAKENAGFNTFGWDTGDANQNGKRDSYDEGDNGAGGGIAQNGIQDGSEVFTGHKVYAETFTKIFSLKKNGTGSYDRDALNRLEAAINANLDPKLHITIKDDGEIVMANGAQDPWNKEYHGWYITNAEVDKKDRGAIVMYSDGANNEFGSEHTIANGVVKIVVPGLNKAGKDDYSIVSCYSYMNGYGEVLNSSTGFSSNQLFTNGNNNVAFLPDNDQSEKEPIVREAGIYKVDGTFISWEDCINNGIVILDGTTIVGSDWYIEGELVIDNHIKEIGDSAFEERHYLTAVEIPSGLTSIGDMAFMHSPNLKQINFPDSITSVGEYVFYDTGLEQVVIGKGMNAIPKNMFLNCGKLVNIVIPDHITVIESNAFAGCGNATSVFIPNSVVSIQNGAFNECYKLESIVIPDSVTEFGSSVFDRCFELKTVHLGTGLTSVPAYTFSNCDKLQEVTLSNNIQYIADSAFSVYDTEVTIVYNGSINDWTNITKDEYWSTSYSTYIIQCLDGTMTLPKSYN